MFLNGNVNYTDGDLTALVDNFKEAMETYKSERNATPTNAVPFDQKYEHLIPDLRNILSEELYRQGYRALLCGLGFIDVLQGVSSTRKESVLNPKPFIAEVNAGVDGFKTVLLEIINLIVLKNKGDHKKLFSDNSYLKITNSPLKINVEVILDQLRSGFVYGVISIQSYQEILGIDPDKELQRMKKEMADDLRMIYYPHLIQNQEATPDLNVSPAPITKKQVEKTQEKTKVPPTMKKADIEEDLVEAPYQNLEDLPKAVKKYPEHAQRIWLAAFNAAYKEKPNDEAYAFRVAWSALQKYMKKQESK